MTRTRSLMCPMRLLCLVVFCWKDAEGDARLDLLSESGQYCFKRTEKNCVPQTFTSSESEGVTGMFLFTRDNPEDPEFLHECGFGLGEDSNYRPQGLTEIFVHGHGTGMCNIAVYREMKDQLLKRGDYNVVLIDWTRVVKLHLKDLLIVARQVATLIRNIMDKTGATERNFHTIGHSLGAHIIGMVGDSVKVRRATGLDPGCYPHPVNGPLDQKLDASDATLVDVIHTSMIAYPLYSGTDHRAGHADFYVNGGKFQPSCKSNVIPSLLKGDIVYGIILAMPHFCPHLQAMEYYKVSINPEGCQFVGATCKSYERFERGLCSDCGAKGCCCAVMGMDFEDYYNPSCGNYRKFYVDTTITCPYCDNSHLNLKGFHNSSSPVKRGSCKNKKMAKI